MSRLADELEAAIKRFHDALPQGQGEHGGQGEGKALCQLFYDNSDTILAALNATQPTDAEVREVAASIMRDVCELPGDGDPDGEDTLILTVDDLQVILDRNLERLAPAAVRREALEEAAKIAESEAGVYTDDGEGDAWIALRIAAAIRQHKDDGE